jgi:hypothetical protein
MSGYTWSPSDPSKGRTGQGKGRTRQGKAEAEAVREVG